MDQGVPGVGEGSASGPLIDYSGEGEEGVGNHSRVGRDTAVGRDEGEEAAAVAGGAQQPSSAPPTAASKPPSGVMAKDLLSVSPTLGTGWGLPSSSLSMLPSISLAPTALSSWFTDARPAKQPALGVAHRKVGADEESEFEGFRAFLQVHAETDYGRSSNPPPQASKALPTTPAASKASFLQFMEKIQGSSDLKELVRHGIASFQQRYPPGGGHDGASLGEALGILLSGLQAKMLAHPHWANASEDEVEQSKEGMEKLVVVKLFDTLWMSDPSDATGDAVLDMRLGGLSFLCPEHLDIPQALRVDSAWKAAREELGKMAGFKAPKDKLVCIHNCCKVLSNAILVANKGTGTSASADDMLPMLIYAMAGSKCPKLHSHLAFIGRCRHPERMTGQLAYYYTLAMSAASFISGVCDADGNLSAPGALSIDPAVFRDSYARCAGGEGWEWGEEEEGGPGEVLTEAEVIVAAVRGGRSEEEELFRYRGETVASLKVRDVAGLLEQYHLALRVIEELSHDQSKSGTGSKGKGSQGRQIGAQV